MFFPDAVNIEEDGDWAGMKEEAAISAPLDEGNGRRTHTDRNEGEIGGLAAGPITKVDEGTRRGRQALARLIKAHGGKVQRGKESARPAQTQNKGTGRASPIRGQGGADRIDGGKD